MSGDSTKKVDRTHHRESMTLAQWKAQKASLPKSCTHCGGALRMPYATKGGGLWFCSPMCRQRHFFETQIKPFPG